MNALAGTITHILFDLHGTLVDSARLQQLYSQGTAQILADRFGGSHAAWAQAHKRIVADWDSYYADLNLSDGDDADCLRDLYEGLYRIIRAHFRLVGIPEPDSQTLKTLSLEVNAIPPSKGDSFYSDAHLVVNYLHQAGYQLGVATHALLAEAENTLIGATVREHFTAPIVCPDVVCRFDKDQRFYEIALQMTQAKPHQCLVVDDAASNIMGAKAAGLHTAYLNRYGKPLHNPDDADINLGTTLTNLPSELEALQLRLSNH